MDNIKYAFWCIASIPAILVVAIAYYSFALVYKISPRFIDFLSEYKGGAILNFWVAIIPDFKAYK